MEKFFATITDFFVSIYNFFISILWFLYELIQFLWFWIKSIFNLLWSLTSSIFADWWILNSFADNYSWLSVYMWSYTNIIWTFVLLFALMIVFNFIIRFLTWKLNFTKRINWK